MRRCDIDLYDLEGGQDRLQQVLPHCGVQMQHRFAPQTVVEPTNPAQDNRVTPRCNRHLDAHLAAQRTSPGKKPPQCLPKRRKH